MKTIPELRQVPGPVIPRALIRAARQAAERGDGEVVPVCCGQPMKRMLFGLLRGCEACGRAEVKPQPEGVA